MLAGAVIDGGVVSGGAAESSPDRLKEKAADSETNVQTITQTLNPLVLPSKLRSDRTVPRTWPVESIEPDDTADRPSTDTVPL